MTLGVFPQLLREIRLILPPHVPWCAHQRMNIMVMGPVLGNILESD